MFWIVIFVVAGIGFAALPLTVFGSIIVALFVSTASVVAVSSALVGKVGFANAFKASTMSLVAVVVVFVLLLNSAFGGALALPAFLVSLVVGLFVYARYLDISLGHALVVSIAASIVNGICMKVLTTVTGS